MGRDGWIRVIEALLQGGNESTAQMCTGVPCKLRLLITHGESNPRKTSTDILIMEGVAAAKNLGEEVEETVTLIRKIGLMVDLSGVERAKGGGETISESARERDGRKKETLPSFI